MKKLIIFLIRRHLGLKKYQKFRFTNQASKENLYYFDNDSLVKIDVENAKVKDAHVALNWLLNDKCKIKKVED